MDELARDVASREQLIVYVAQLAPWLGNLKSWPVAGGRVPALQRQRAMYPITCPDDRGGH